MQRADPLSVLAPLSSGVEEYVLHFLPGLWVEAFETVKMPYAIFETVKVPYATAHQEHQHLQSQVCTAHHRSVLKGLASSNSLPAFFRT